VIHLIGLFMVLNALDGILTSKAVAAGIAREMNPILAPILAYSVPLFLLTKFAMGITACFLLYGARKHVSAVLALSFACGVYGLLVSYQVAMLCRH
jgi:hypothetical protein